MPENSEGYPIDPQITSNDEVEKPKTLESHRADRVRKLGGVRGKLAAVGLGIATSLSTSSSVFAEENPDVGMQPSESVAAQTLTRQETELENYVERKYEIE